MWYRESISKITIDQKSATGSGLEERYIGVAAALWYSCCSVHQPFTETIFCRVYRGGGEEVREGGLNVSFTQLYAHDSQSEGRRGNMKGDYGNFFMKWPRPNSPLNILEATNCLPAPVGSIGRATPV